MFFSGVVASKNVADSPYLDLVPKRGKTNVNLSQFRRYFHTANIFLMLDYTNAITHIT